MKKKYLKIIIAIIAILALNMNYASAHCDHVEGPVIKAAKNAIAENNVNYILIWVQPADEVKLTKLFNEALPKIKAGDSATEQKFYEDLVKIHRSGEGVEFDGVIKQVGAEIEPVIVAADAAIETGNLAVLHPYVIKSQEFHDEVVRKYMIAMSMKNYDVNNLSAGRAYVTAYVNFMKFVEGEEEPETKTNKDIVKETKSGNTKLPWLLAGVFGITAITLGVSRFSMKKRK